MSRERLQPRLRTSRGGWVALTTIALGIAVWVTATSPIFDIHTIDVVGNHRLRREDVLALARTPLGENLLLLSIGGVERRLRASPWVARAEAVRDLPSTLVLRLTERTPVAWLRQGSGAVVLAGDGVVLEAVAAAPGNLPLLDARVRAPEPGGRAAGIDALLRVAASFPPRLRRMVAEARLVGSEVELTLRDAVTVRYGRPDALPPKNGAIIQMLRYAAEQDLQVEYLDVRAPSAPALKPVGAPAQAAVAEPTEG